MNEKLRSNLVDTIDNLPGAKLFASQSIIDV